MPPVLDTVGAAVASANNVATPVTLTPVLPAHAAGKLLLAATFCRSGTPTVATPAGWVQLANVVGTNGRIALFGKIAVSGSESNPGITWSGLTTGTSGSPVQAQCAVVSGALETLTGIVDILGAVENGAAATATAASGAAISTVEANDLVLSLSCRLDDVGTWTPPAGFTAIGSALTTSGADMSFAWAYQVKATPGSVAPADFGLSGASSFASTGVLIALKQHVPVTYFGAISRPITFGAAIKGDKPAIVQKMETLQDDFSTPPEAPIWNDGVSYGWNGSALTIDCIPTFGYISTWDGAIAGVYDLISSYIYAKITPPSVGNGTKETYLEISSVGTSGPTRDGVSFYITGSNLSALKKIDGVTVNQATPRTYDPINDQWLRIREQSATIYCDTSPDGINWTNFWTTPLNFNVSQCWAAFTCGYSGTEGASSAIVDDINIPQVPAGPTTHYGITSTLLVLNQVIQGRRQTFSQIAAPFIFSKEVQGRRKAFGQIIAPFLFSKDIQGQRKTFGQLLSPYLFSKDVRGQRKTFGQTALPINVAITTSGFRVGLTQYGIVALPVGFASTTNGRRKTFGQVSLSSVFSKDVRGQRKTFGQISLPIIFTKEAIGREWVYGQLSMQTLFGKEISGRRKTFSQLTLPIAFTKDIRAQRKAFGQIARPINFLAFVDGQSFVGPKTYYGQLVSPFVFNKQVTAYRKTFGQVTAPFIFGSASQGQRKTFSQSVFPINFVIDVETGRVGTHSQILLPLFIDFDIDGKAFKPGVILNLADTVYLGSELAEAIYVGIEKVWPIFDPTKIAGLKIWLDANQLGLVDGGMINTWPSLADLTLVGTNFNIAPYRPTLRAAALNGLSVARFIAGSGLRWSGFGLEGEAGLNWTCVFVSRMWGTTPGRVVTAGYPPTNILIGYHGGNEDKAFVEGWLFPDVGHAQTTNWHLYTATQEGVVGSTKAWFYSNGVFLSGDHQVTGGWNGSSFHLNGYAPTSGEETCDCEIAEVIFYDRKLLDIERQQVEGYLREKWGL